MTDAAEYDAYDLRRPRAKRKGLSEEWRLQCACAKIARQVARTDKAFRYEFLNTEGKRDPKRANIAKMMGLERGVLEIRLYHKHNGVIRRAVGECKSAKGKLTPEQAAWFEYYEGTHDRAFLVRSVEDFWEMVKWVCSR